MRGRGPVYCQTGVQWGEGEGEGERKDECECENEGEGEACGSRGL